MLTQLNQLIRFVNCLSLEKILNVLKLASSYRISILFKRSLHIGLPMSLAVEPANACNLKCVACSLGTSSLSRKPGMMSYEMFKSIIDQTKKTLIHVTLYFQGEPFLNKQLSTFIKYAKQNNIYTLVSTNGHFLEESICNDLIDAGLDKLIISIDGYDDKSYSSYRVGGDIQKVLSGLEAICRIKKQRKVKYPKVVVQTLVLKSNEDDLLSIKQLALSGGADEFILKSAQFYNFEDGHPLMPSQGKYARYMLNINGKYSIKNKLHNRCWRMWSSFVFTWDGLVLPCCYDKDANHSMGSINSELIYTIWRNQLYKQFRQELLENRKSKMICLNCPE